MEEPWRGHGGSVRGAVGDACLDVRVAGDEDELGIRETVSGGVSRFSQRTSQAPDRLANSLLDMGLKPVKEEKKKKEKEKTKKVRAASMELEQPWGAPRWG